MKVIHIFGDNYSGHFRKSRAACRACIRKDGKLLLSYETKTGQWMLPGGGLEEGETDAACCVREVEEETGVLVEASACFLEIDEYYEDVRWVNRYFLCSVIGEGRRQLTQQEAAEGLEPRWLPFDEIKGIFGGHHAYADTDEMRRGLYQREFTALCELEKVIEA